ncbi:GYDIA family GHMP kinase [uncultured Flavobacterium sp.]|uniref:GYDIA family GHMP kinase n=1 Tax=uncultured Flavobacterium sp. TaxID=165435 RepID=UPI0030CA4E41|tara:strand:- start:1252 stop:2166 length:915 start_codon:yes stop_codon:yes gene_type:complete
MNKQTFYSNGKLLFTGEYLVLNGAKSLAVPTKFGQSLDVTFSAGNTLNWKSYDFDGSIWFKDEIKFEDIIAKTSFDEHKIKNTLVKILHHAYLMNTDFISKSKGYTLHTKLTFPRLWGLGTSSTLINNIAQWLQIDAFELLKNSFGGSGYDIACAQTDTPIIYQLHNEKPSFKTVDFNPVFRKHIYFVYLNKKQSSKSAINNYLKKQVSLDKAISRIDDITTCISETDDINEFMNAIDMHEAIISDVLEQLTIKESIFPDFKGSIKSLGAWGGDFVMAISQENPVLYFNNKGYKTVLKYEDMVL